LRSTLDSFNRDPNTTAVDVAIRRYVRQKAGCGPSGPKNKKQGAGARYASGLSAQGINPRLPGQSDSSQILCFLALWRRKEEPAAPLTSVMLTLPIPNSMPRIADLLPRRPS
jgi:hypothetical protein